MHASQNLSSPQAAPSPLTRLTQICAPDMGQIDALLNAQTQSALPLVPQLGQHILQGSGKRLRPLLATACAQLFPGDSTRHIAIAACIECLHTATLLHDDVVDESMMRRGKPAANTIWGNKASVLVGDFLLTNAFQLIVADGCPQVMGILSRASNAVVAGEIMQLSLLNDFSADESAYLAIIRSKTAALFAAACEVAGAIAKSPAPQREALAQYGENLGIAFQLIDDMLDYGACAQTLGKAPGDDFRSGNMTLPLLRAYAASNSTEKDFWHRTIIDQQQEEGDFAQARILLQKYQSLEATKKCAQDYAARAAAALDVFPPSEVRDLLKDLAFYSVERGA